MPSFAVVYETGLKMLLPNIVASLLATQGTAPKNVNLAQKAFSLWLTVQKEMLPKQLTGRLGPEMQFFFSINLSIADFFIVMVID